MINTDLVPFTSYLLAAMALAAVLVVGILATLSTQAVAQVVASRRTNRASADALSAAWGRASHQH